MQTFIHTIARATDLDPTLVSGALTIAVPVILALILVPSNPRFKF